eukprot:755807-Amphidinium_carterae.1
MRSYPVSDIMRQYDSKHRSRSLPLQLWFDGCDLARLACSACAWRWHESYLMCIRLGSSATPARYLAEGPSDLQQACGRDTCARTAADHGLAAAST